MTKENARLTVEVTDGRLVISIGIDTLAYAAETMPSNNPYQDDKGEFIQTVKVTDPVEFAKRMLSALTDLLDKAFQSAIDDGSLGVEVKD